MTIELRDIITALSVLVAIAGMLLVNRNAKRALRPAAENTDLTRIRDLRHEIKETRDELDRAKAQVTQLTIQVQEATDAVRTAYRERNDAAFEAHRERMEMIRYAQMPGMDIKRWLDRFEGPAALSDRG